jgi:MFS family permease
VPREHLIEANGKLATSNSVARIAGPGLAGGLVQLLTAPGAVVVDALSFLGSALSLSLIRTLDVAPPRTEQRPSIWAEIGEGLRALGGNPFLRAFVASSATLDVFWNALMAVYFLFVTRDLQLPPIAFGLIFGLGSVGALLGSLVAGWVGLRFGLGPAVVGAQLVLGLGGLLIVLAVRLPAAALPLLVAAEVVQSFTSTIYAINREGLSQAVTPDRLRGRVGASRHFFGLGAVVVGSLLGGVLGERIGVPATMVVGACGGVLAFVWLLLSPLRTLRELPQVNTA